MSLSPQVRRERRALAARYREPKKFPRRRCDNDGKWYLKTRKNKRFCSKACKDEYNRYGSAFGPLRDYLTKLIGKASKEEVARAFAAFVASKDFRRQLAAAGFIHRSMLRPRNREQASAGLQEQMRELAGRITALEQRPSQKTPDARAA